MIEVVFQKISNCQTKEELDILIRVFSNQDFCGVLDSAGVEIKTVFARAIREKIFNLVFAKGEVCDREYLYLFGLFKDIEIETDGAFDRYIKLAESGLSDKKLSTSEIVLFVELKFISMILNFQARAGYKEYIKNMITCEIHDTNDLGVTNFFEKYIKFFPIEIGQYLEILIENLEKNYYFSLNATQRRSIFNWSYHVFWGLPGFFINKEWHKMYTYWRDVYFEHLKRGELGEAMYLQFYITIKMGSNFQTTQEWSDFQEDILKPIIPHYLYRAKNLPKCKKEMTKRGRKIIGVLKERATANSPFKVEYSLWKSLMEDEAFTNNYEIRIYYMGYVEQSLDEPTVVEAYKKINLKYIDVVTPVIRQKGFYHSHLEKALVLRKKIIEDGVDILISPLAYVDISDFLVISRCAPKQIYWSHGSFIYDVPNIDKRISHFEKSVDCMLEYETFKVAMDVERFYNPYRDPTLIAQERNKYPKDAFILGVIGRLTKVNSDEYLETIAKIMEQTPNTIFIAAGSGNRDTIREKVEKLGISDRFYMPGFVDAHVYGHIIDLWCDTFPLGQGESLYEFMFKGNGKTFVSLKDDEYLTSCEIMLDEMLSIEKRFCEDSVFDEFKKYLDANYDEPFYMTYIADSIDSYIKKINQMSCDKKLRDGINYYFIKFVEYQSQENIEKLVGIF